MEISRKKITSEYIYASEKQLADDVRAEVESCNGKFSSLGYVLETEFTRDNDSNDLTPEEQEKIRASKIEEEPGTYVNGYTSSVKITVKHIKTEEDIAAEKAAEEPEETDEILSAEEIELRQNERVLEKAKREQARNVAFTTMMFVRVYKTFWRETVSISDNIDEIKADLEEFFTVLSEKAQNGEV